MFQRTDYDESECQKVLVFLSGPENHCRVSHFEPPPSYLEETVRMLTVSRSDVFFPCLPVPRAKIVNESGSE